MMVEMITKSCTWEKNPGMEWAPSTGIGRHSYSQCVVESYDEDDSNQDSDNSDDDAHVPTTAATPMVEMDGEGGENTATDAIMNTGI